MKLFRKTISLLLTLLLSLGLYGLFPRTAYATTVIITSGTSWTVPSDWNDADNSIEVIGGGGGGGGGGNVGGGAGSGAGGAYAEIVNADLTPDGSVTISIGAGGTAGSTAESNGGTGGDTYFNASACANADAVNSVCAKGGGGGGGGTGGTAGTAGATQSGSVGDTVNLGGAGAGGGAVSGNGKSGGGGGGGGGAGGLNGAGNAGVDGFEGAGGSCTTSPCTGDGGDGGQGDVTSGGTGGTGGTGNTSPGGTGGNGGDGTEWTTAGSGGGAGGGGGGSNNANGGPAGTAGSYGAGGGGGGAGGGSGSGAAGSAGIQGVIVITYTPTGGATAPTVTTNAETNVAVTSATLNGEITATGGENSTSRGFAWGTTSDLSTSVATTTESGSFGTGTFSTNISGLKSGTTYYFRAYATNTGGTGYGAIDNFTTTTDTTPSRTMRLFEGYTIKFTNGRILLHQKL